jgi:FHS family L-fucose permease-like MFS transporter
LPFVAVTSLFFMWGFITVLVDGLIPRLKAVFELTYLQAGLVQFAWFAAYGLISIPGGRLIERVGYQRGILVGLAMAGAGCLLFYPAAGTRIYLLFLLALFVVASGITILQVAANPYIAVLGDPARASSRLNLAQAFNSLGTTIAPVVAAGFLLSDTILTADAQSSLGAVALDSYHAAEAAAVQSPFVLLAGAFGLLAVAMGAVKLPRILGREGGDAGAGHSAVSDSRSRYAYVLANKRLVLGAIGIFLYVGAEVALGSYMVNYGVELGVGEIFAQTPWLQKLAGLAASITGSDVASMDVKGLIGTLLTFYWGGAMLGRFAGSALMQRLAPARILVVFALAAVVLIGLSIATTGAAALMALIAVGLCNSIMFPTIFSLAIEELEDYKPEGSGILCTAIVGGAFIPPAVGGLTDAYGFGIAFLLPALCYIYIAFYARRVGQ